MLGRMYLVILAQIHNFIHKGFNKLRRSEEVHLHCEVDHVAAWTVIVDDAAAIERPIIQRDAASVCSWKKMVNANETKQR